MTILQKHMKSLRGEVQKYYNQYQSAKADMEKAENIYRTASNDANVFSGRNPRSLLEIARMNALAETRRVEMEQARQAFQRVRKARFSVMDAAKKIASGQIDPEALYDCSYEERMEILKSIFGVGEKVANCICLFGYGCTSAAPVDTWIRKVIDTVYAGKEPFSAFGNNAGIVQQYVFYYAVSQKKI